MCGHGNHLQFKMLTIDKKDIIDDRNEKKRREAVTSN